jgi:type VI secretion system protein ImpJ
MSWHNRVIWSEGLFLRPQHFQQHQRYIESFVEARCTPLKAHGWGLTELGIDHDLLRIGKLAIASARGVFPDGTPFSIPEDDPPPPPLELDENVRDSIVYLSLPVRRQGMQEVGNGSDEEGLARYTSREFETADVCTPGMASALMEVGALRMKLLLEKNERDEYACIGVAHILEQQADKQVLLRDDYIASVANVQAAPRLSGFVTELQGLLHARGEALAARVADGGRGAAEIADFLMLQAVNRYEPLIAHLSELDGLHPEELYRMLVMMAGELATLTSASRRAREFPTYKHHDLRGTFTPVMTAIRECFATTIAEIATPLLLKERRFGIRVSQVNDRTLFKQAVFVLAVRADMPADDLLRRFPSTVKIGSVEKIRDFVNYALPGITLRPLPVAPRQIPYHAGFAYFELERGSPHWAELETSGGIAIHVSGNFPGLQLEFWAIRGQ